MTVVGVDGYLKGWVAIELEEGRFRGASVHEGFNEVLGRYVDADVVAVDIPIGMPEKEPRAADLAAKAMLGARRSSVFLCPPRRVLECETHAEATALAKELTGSGISQQAFALRRRILEVDALVDDRVIEVHPEVSFVALAGRPLSGRKKSWAGAMERRDALTGAGIEIPTDLGPAGLAPVDDVLDAAVAAWSAQRYAGGEAVSIPDNPPVDQRGRRVAIWY